MDRGSWQGILELARKQGAITPADVRAMGLAPENLNKLAKIGLLVRAGRGIYEHPNFEWTENHSYVEVCKAIPEAVLCLLSSLRVHDIGTQNPHQVWVAIPRDQRPPKSRGTQLRVVRMSPEQYSQGVESHEFEGVAVKVYSLEKTIIDCFRLRRHVGHDVGVEALKDALGKRMIDINELLRIAKKLRVTSLLMPYLEALTQ